MRNIYYSNIIYSCNNNCKNCISHSVQECNNCVISLNDYRIAIENSVIENTDIWNINGGEPTLNPDLLNIINLCHSNSKHIILYTNGRNLNRLPGSTLKKIERIILPIYGDKEFHNEYVQNSFAYQETVESISRVINLYPDKCDIKLFVTSKKQLDDLKNDPIWSSLQNNKYFSVTRILNGYKDNVPPTQEIVILAEKLIKELVDYGKTVRFYDLPFCGFSNDFKKYLLSIFDGSFDFNPIVNCVCKNGKIKQSFYRCDTDYFPKCRRCNLRSFCTMIMKNYFCPVIDGARCYISTE